MHWRRAGDCDGGGEYELEHFASSGMRDFISRVAALLAYNFVMLTDDDKQWISQRLEKVETTLLTEFHKWASPADMRARTHAAALRAIDLEMESLADRVQKLEDRP